jgi:hypothetical protein
MRLLKITVKQSKLITNYAKVAKKVTDNGLEFDEQAESEWDFIIVGGGKYCENIRSAKFKVSSSSRHCRMCSSISSL